VVASCDRGNYPVVGFSDESGDVVECFPSIVAEKDGELRFGFAAERAAVDPAWTTLYSFKRLLSDPHRTRRSSSVRRASGSAIS